MPKLESFFAASLIAVSALACSTVSLADGSPAPSGSSDSDFRFQKALTAPTKVEVRDQNGAIHVEPATGDTLEIVAVKSGRREDFARVTVVTREEAGTIVVCAIWPGQDPSTCRSGAFPSGRNENDVRVRVDFRVRVPAKVSTVAAHTMNGEIEANSPAGGVELHTMNGKIDVTAKGPITAETMNGGVTARAEPGNPVNLTTKNGKVEVQLAPSANADVQASTTNGRVTSELCDVPSPSIPRLHEVKLRLGAGGTPISLRTLNGDVRVRRAGT